jgi:hypothetical protein
MVINIKICAASGKLSQIERQQKGRACSTYSVPKIGVGKLARIDRFRPMCRNDLRDAIQPFLVNEEARIDGYRIAHDTQPQAGWASAIGHGLADIDRDQTAYRAIAGNHRLKPAPDAWIVLRFGRQDQRHAAIGQGHQLRVEQIGLDRIGKAYRRCRNLDDFDLREEGAQIAVEIVPVGKGQFMRKKNALIGVRA